MVKDLCIYLKVELFFARTAALAYCPDDKPTQIDIHLYELCIYIYI